MSCCWYFLMLSLLCFYSRVPHALFLSFIIYKVPCVCLILHKTANVPGPFPENLVIYDQNEVESSALKPSWLLHHWTTSRNFNCLSQPAADQINLRQHWGLIHYLYPLICCLSITSIPLLPHSGADVYIMICYTSCDNRSWTTTRLLNVLVIWVSISGFQ